LHDEDWAVRAACRGADVGLFYSTEEADVRRALSYCARCEVREACLEVAMSREEAFGVWGGTPETHRRRIFRRERRQRQRSAA
jgi:hypothetical protein